MKTLKLIALAAFALLFACCKATQPTGPSSNSGASVFPVVKILDTVYTKFYNLARANPGSTPGQVMLMTASWIKSLGNVQSVGAVDSLNLDIQLKSGLHTIFSFIVSGPDSVALTRGCAPPTKPSTNRTSLRSSVLSTNTIKNKNVLIYCPFIVPNGGWAWLYRRSEIDSIANIVRNTGQGFNVTITEGSSLNDVNAFGNYGLVLIETHGLPFGFHSGIGIRSPVLWYDSVTHDNTDTMTEAELQPYIDRQLGAGGYDLIQTGTLSFGLYIGECLSPSFANWQNFLKPPVKGYIADQDFDVIIRSEYLQTLPPMKNTVILGNFCYSGWAKIGTANNIIAEPIQVQYPIATAFENLQPISYYSYGYGDGYSNILDNAFAKEVEDSLVTALVVNGDSTGNAYLHSDGTNFSLPTQYKNEPYFYFLQYGSNDYSYMKCGDTLTDTRDGQKYPTVCIGTQVWMAKNLNYNAPGSVCYNNDPANCNTYGKMYDWNTVMQGATSSSAAPSGVQGICPKGWHIPSQQEFNILGVYLGGVGIAGGLMKSTSSLWDTATWQSPNVGATNSSGFCALPGGDASSSSSFTQISGVASFWTSTEVSGQPTRANLQWLTITNPNLYFFQNDKTLLISCRCVKDP